VASYSVFLKRPAAKQLEEIGLEADRRRIADRIRALAEDPRPVGPEKLAGRRDRLRIRQADYRVIYSVDDSERAVTVVRIVHRRDAYRSRS
jgi:mRNA interferase RelE/StbE